MWMALTSSLFSSDLKFSCFSKKRHIGEAHSRGWDNIKAFFPSLFSLGESHPATRYGSCSWIGTYKLSSKGWIPNFPWHPLTQLPTYVCEWIELISHEGAITSKWGEEEALIYIWWQSFSAYPPLGITRTT
jgi:hypothetical protein